MIGKAIEQRQMRDKSVGVDDANDNDKTESE